MAVKNFDAPLSETPIRIRLLLETTADMLPFVLRGLDSVEAKVSVESIMYLSSTDNMLQKDPDNFPRLAKQGRP